MAQSATCLTFNPSGGNKYKTVFWLSGRIWKGEGLCEKYLCFLWKHTTVSGYLCLYSAFQTDLNNYASCNNKNIFVEVWGTPVNCFPGADND